MKLLVPSCTSCGGRFACIGCERLLSRQFATMSEDDYAAMRVGGAPGAHRFARPDILDGLYASRFPVGPNGGALIDFGRAVVLECLFSYVVPTTKKVLAYVPRPFDGTTIVHDLRATTVRPEDIAACKAGRCDCDSRPTGWVLTRPILRALLSVSDHWIREFGRLLPGALPRWELAVATPVFMESFFDPTFRLPTRAISRPIRAARARARRQDCGHPPRRRRTRRRE